MIFGALFFPQKFMQTESALQRIADVVTWQPSVTLHFRTESVTASFMVSPGIPSEYHDTFYHDALTGTSVVFDGFLYNRDEIASATPSCKPSMPVPELVARAFHFRGPEFATILNGDFAFYICLEKQKQAFFYRDHLGVRPLAIVRSGKTLFFSTDMKGLCKALFRDMPVDREYLVNLFLTAGHDYTLLPQQPVTQVKPGHFCRISPEEQEMNPYWFPEKVSARRTLTRSEALEEALHLLKDAVRIRSDIRFNASAHVSGGLDSGIVASLARKEYAGQSLFYGFSWSPHPDEDRDESPNDERKRVQALCRMNLISPLFSGFNGDDYHTFVSDWHHPSELLFEKKITEEAKTRGINLIFSGWGGDEFVSLSDRGIDADLVRNLNFKHLVRKYNLLHFKGIISAIRYNTSIWAVRRKYSSRKTSKWVYPYIRKALKNNCIPIRERFSHRSRRDVHLQLLRKGHLADRTGDWYVLGQHNGIEYRYPLLDWRFVEFMLSIPSHCLVHGHRDRSLIRELGKEYLPPEVCQNCLKEDVSLSRRFRRVAPEIQQKYSLALDDFRNNPELSFVDFDLLRKHLPIILRKSRIKSDPETLSIFYYLKKAHEFTCGFHKVIS